MRVDRVLPEDRTLQTALATELFGQACLCARECLKEGKRGTRRGAAARVHHHPRVWCVLCLSVPVPLSALCAAPRFGQDSSQKGGDVIAM